VVIFYLAYSRFSIDYWGGRCKPDRFGRYKNGALIWKGMNSFASSFLQVRFWLRLDANKICPVDPVALAQVNDQSKAIFLWVE